MIQQLQLSARTLRNSHSEAAVTALSPTLNYHTNLPKPIFLHGADIFKLGVIVRAYEKVGLW